MITLTPKDRRAMTIGGAALLIFVLIQFILFPLLDKRKKLNRSIAAKQTSLIEMREMQSAWVQLSHQNNTLEQRVSRRSADFGLFAFLEGQAAGAGVKEAIDYMKPSDASGEGELQQVMVEMKLKAITLRQIVAFLERIESPVNIVELKRISIQKNKKEEGTLDVIMQVVSLVLTGEED